MISIKIYKSGNDMIIGACDKNLLGKRFEEGKFQLEVTKEFYGGERIDIKTFKKYLLEATIANLVGKLTIKCAIESGFINPNCIIKIDGVPHAQMVKMLT